MVLIIDPQIAGISGDMLLSALVDLGAKKSKIIEGVKISQNFLHRSKIEKIDFKKVDKHGVNATSLVLKLDEHFHEAASIDTVVDIIGTAIALDDLKCFDQEIITLPVAVGNGTVSFSHGTVSNPAGAILGIFAKSGILIAGNNAKDELATPTGASMLVNLASRCVQYYPLMKVDSVGYGAGQKNFEGFSNVLKLVQGEKSSLESDTVSILETNVDDVSGEVLAHVIDKIMATGAKDVSVIPTMTKKGRPSHMISVICNQKDVDKLAHILISETGTLGIRIRSSERFIVPRKIISIKIKIHNKDFTVRCKTTSKHQFKVEYDDIKAISNKLSLTFKQTEELIKAEVKKQLK